MFVGLDRLTVSIYWQEETCEATSYISINCSAVYIVSLLSGANLMSFGGLASYVILPFLQPHRSQYKRPSLPRMNGRLRVDSRHSIHVVRPDCHESTLAG